LAIPEILSMTGVMGILAGRDIIIKKGEKVLLWVPLCEKIPNYLNGIDEGRSRFFA
jgi:hypothetical protein